MASDIILREIFTAMASYLISRHQMNIQSLIITCVILAVVSLLVNLKVKLDFKCLVTEYVSLSVPLFVLGNKKYFYFTKRFLVLLFCLSICFSIFLTSCLIIYSLIDNGPKNFIMFTKELTGPIEEFSFETCDQFEPNFVTK